MQIRWNCIDGRVCNIRFFQNSLLIYLFSSVFTCTSNGMLRKSMFTAEQQKDPFKIPESHCSTLPSRLFDWRLSEDTQTFAYGGDEVDLSVWNTGIAFENRSIPASSSSAIKKRKRNDDLFPGEIWRARNVRFFLSIQLQQLIVFLKGSKRSPQSSPTRSNNRIVVSTILSCWQ